LAARSPPVEKRRCPASRHRRSNRGGEEGWSLGFFQALLGRKKKTLPPIFPSTGCVNEEEGKKRYCHEIRPRESRPILFPGHRGGGVCTIFPPRLHRKDLECPRLSGVYPASREKVKGCCSNSYEGTSNFQNPKKRRCSHQKRACPGL